MRRLHHIYRGVVTRKVAVQDGQNEIRTLLKAPPLWSNTQRVCGLGLASFLLCLTSFRGSIIDALISAPLGALVGFLQIVVVGKTDMFVNIFEYDDSSWPMLPLNIAIEYSLQLRLRSAPEL